MNKHDDGVIVIAIVFFVVWLIAGLVWSIWLDGIWTAIAGCLTSLAVIGVIKLVFNIGGGHHLT
ncbi:MAG: hypothetical protein ABIJ21_02465 [Nanoarchaeota archaeon]